MSADASSPARPQRSDAERNRATILDAAVAVLGQRPDASVEDIAKAAGLSRQTIYAHFPSRDDVVRAVLDRATAEALSAVEAANLDDGPPAAALLRLFDASWQVFERYPLLLDAASLPVTPDEDRHRHEPVRERLERLIRHGQAAGDFDPGVSATWLVTATIALGHAAGQEVAAGRMSIEQASTAAAHSVMRLVGATSPTDR